MNSIIRASGQVLHLHHARKVVKYQDSRKKRFHIRVTWHAPDISGSMFYFNTDEVYDDFYEDNVPELYQALSNYIDGSKE